jgi:hypothetical protein
MTIEHICRVALHRFLKTKSDMCNKQCGPTPLTAMAEATFRHGSKNHVLGILIGDPQKSLADFLKSIESADVPENVVVLADGYRGEPTSANYYYGQLAEDFKENLFTSVCEILWVEGIDVLAGKQYHIIQPYSYGDDGLPVFDSESFFTHAASLFFGEILSTWCAEKRANRRRRRRPR